MKSTYVQTVAPAQLAVSLPEAKVQLREDGTAQDELIETFIGAAVDRLERATDRQLVTATWKLLVDRFPRGREAMRLEKCPIQSVTSLKYFDLAGMQQTLVEGTDYEVDTDSEPGRIVPAVDATWPSTRRIPNAVEAVFDAGYGDPKDVNLLAKAAIMLDVQHQFNNREAVVIGQGNAVFELPLGWQSIVESLGWGAYG